jgi:ribosomal protein L29
LSDEDARLQQLRPRPAAGQTSEVLQTSEVSRQLAQVETQVDEAAAELWGIKDKELKEICPSLKE